MTADWVSVARGLAASIGDSIEVVPRERWLTKRLLEFVFEPTDRSAATMTLAASSDQMMFFAGRGARFELDGPDRASEEVADLARAVAAGGLTERVGRHRVRFLIDLGNGEEVSGSSTLRRSRWNEEKGTYHYAPYPASKNEDS